MLINSKNEPKGNKLIFGAVFLLCLLLIIGLFVPKEVSFFTKNSHNDSAQKDASSPTVVVSKLNLKDFLSSQKNLLHQKDNFSVYLNQEFGAPTLMIVYADSLSEKQKNSRFLAFLHLKDAKKWKSFNQKVDYIQIAKDSLIPVRKEIENRTYFIFKFRLEHPYFNMTNLKSIEFLRHTREFGGFDKVNHDFNETDSIYSSSNTLKKLEISMKSSAFEKIIKKRNAALKAGILVTDEDDFVNAKVSVDDQKSKSANVRLKGDWTDHLEHPSKWSYRIVSEGEETIMGMRKLSVQHPKSRNYAWEWLFNKVIKDNDLTGLRYDFLDVSLRISDKDSIVPMGIMALEESFDKILIENNRRREGLILGIDESMIWDERKQVKELALEYPKDADVRKPSELPIKVYNETKILSSPVLSKQFEIAKNLMVGLRDRKLSLSEVFDVEKLAFYIALSNLFGAHHGLHIENIRVYYNPVTNTLEPVSFDSNSGIEITTLREYPIGLEDPIFTEKLIEAYEKVSSEEFINGFLNKHSEKLDILSSELLIEFNEVSIDLSVLQHNANLIKKKIAPNTPLNASLISHQKGKMELEIQNFAEFPIVIDGLVLANGKLLNQSNKRLVLGAKENKTIVFTLKESFNNAFVSKKNKEGGFRYPKDLKRIRLQHHILGSEIKMYDAIKAFESGMASGFVETRKRNSRFKDFEFITSNETTNKLTFKSGSFILNEVLYIPPNYEVFIEPGFQLDLINQASIISYSPFFSIGTKQKPIHILSTDDTGGGIFVSSTSKKSTLSYTYFTNLSVPQWNSWSLSGAVNFNEAEVKISNCVFEKNRSEDALNVIRTSFAVDSTSFIDTYSDSFDGDFVVGSISNSTFINSGNDGIDVSGSQIELQNIVVENPSDKGLSAGENSMMNGVNIIITDGEIGVVSKDLSRVNLSGITIKNTRLGMACFQKKSEFGPGIIDLKKTNLINIEVAYLIEPSSELIIDDIAILDKSEMVIDLMYGKEYGKSSR